jgi:hypothetical protein
VNVKDENPPLVVSDDRARQAKKTWFNDGIDDPGDLPRLYLTSGSSMMTSSIFTDISNFSCACFDIFVHFFTLISLHTRER